MIKLKNKFVFLCLLFFPYVIHAQGGNTSKNIFHYGHYDGSVAFEIDSLNGKTFAFLSSSLSQVYKEDKNFDCKLFLLAENVHDKPDSFYFKVFNMEGGVRKECGFAYVSCKSNNKIKLFIKPTNDNIGMCGASIDFSSSITLEWSSTPMKKKLYQVVNTDKCFLYNSTINPTATKIYLIKGDRVEVVKKQAEWSRIRYISEEGKYFEKWIKSECLSDK